MPIYQDDPHLSDHHLRMIDANFVPHGKTRKRTPLTRGPFGKPERRFDRVWVDDRVKVRLRRPRVHIIVCQGQE